MSNALRKPELEQPIADRPNELPARPNIRLVRPSIPFGDPLDTQSNQSAEGPLASSRSWGPARCNCNN